MQALFIEISFLPDVGTCPLTLSLIYSLSLSLSHIVDNPFKKKKSNNFIEKRRENTKGKRHTGKKKVTMKVQKSSISGKEIKVKTPVAFAQSNKL